MRNSPVFKITKKMINLPETRCSNRGQGSCSAEPESGAPARHQFRGQFHGHNISNNVAGGGNRRTANLDTSLGVPGDDVCRRGGATSLFLLDSSRIGVTERRRLWCLYQRRFYSRGHRAWQAYHTQRILLHRERSAQTDGGQGLVHTAADRR